MYFALHATIISQHFGMKHFSRNWGTAMLSFALIGWIIKALFKVLVDYEVEKKASHTLTFLVISVFTFVATILAAILVYRFRIRVMEHPSGTFDDITEHGTNHNNASL